MGFGNSPAGDMTAMIPPGSVAHIVNVKYAGTYPLRRGITNPPLTTPQFPSNPPRASSKSPTAVHVVNDPLTLTRPTHTMLGSIAAGGYKGSVGQVVRGSDGDSGARLRGVMLAGRLAEGGVGTLRPWSLGVAAMRTTETLMQLDAGATQEVRGVATYRIESGAEFVQCQILGGALKVKALLGVGSAVIVYTLTGAVTIGDRPPVDHVLPVSVQKEELGQVALAAVVETAQKIKDLMATRGTTPAPTIDWQDAAILRSTAGVIRAPIRDLWGRVGCGTTCMRQCQQAMDILITAQQNPDLQTLRQVLEKYAADRSKSVPDAILAVVGNGPDPAYKKAVGAAADLEFLSDVAAVANVIIAAAMTVIGTVMPAAAAITMAVALASSQAAEAMDGASSKQTLRAFGAAIRHAAQDPNTLPARLVGNALVRTEVVQTANVLLAQATAGFAGTPTQTAAFSAAYRLLQDAGLEAQDPQNGLRPDPAFANLLRAIRAARPDLCGLSSSLMPTLTVGDTATWAAANPLWGAAKLLNVAAGRFALFYAFNPAQAAMPVAVVRFGGRTYPSSQEFLRVSYAEYEAALTAAPKPLADPFRARLTSTLTTLAMVARGIPGKVPAHPEVLQAAGIPNTLPVGYAEFFDQPGPGNIASPPQTSGVVAGGMLPPAAPNGAMTGPDYNADGAPDSPRGDDPVKTSKAPLVIGGGLVLAGAAWLLLR